MTAILRLWWLWIILLSFFTYFPVIDNFFVWDDFLWLYRVKILHLNPLQIFQPERLYFDPLIYLSFWFNFKLFGLDYRWYHITDMAIHAINGLLVYRFVKLYSDDGRLAILSGLIFVSSFGVSDAVLWSSSRVDLLATLFSLITLILFHRYLTEYSIPSYIASVFSFILALGAKGTPVILPVLLLWISLRERRDRKEWFSPLIPFVFTASGYLLLLATAGGTVPKRVFYPNIHNLALGFTTFLIPETILAKFDPLFASFLIYGILLVLLVSWFIRFPPQIDRIKSISLFMIFLFLVPVMFLDNFLLASAVSSKNILASPSHRVYLASTGMAIFAGCIINWLCEGIGSRKLLAKAAIPIVLLVVLSANIYGTRSREKLWEEENRAIKASLYNLKDVIPNIPERSVVVAIDYPMSRGFIEPLLKLYYEVKEISVIPVNQIPDDLVDALAFAAENEVFLRDTFLIVSGRSHEIYDLSTQFKELLNKAYGFYNGRDPLSVSPIERMKSRQEYFTQAVNLNRMIDGIRAFPPGKRH